MGAACQERRCGCGSATGKRHADHKAEITAVTVRCAGRPATAARPSAKRARQRRSAVGDLGSCVQEADRAKHRLTSRCSTHPENLKPSSCAAPDAGVLQRVCRASRARSVALQTSAWSLRRGVSRAGAGGASACSKRATQGARGAEQREVATASAPERPTAPRSSREPRAACLRAAARKCSRQGQPNSEYTSCEHALCVPAASPPQRSRRCGQQACKSALCRLPRLRRPAWVAGRRRRMHAGVTAPQGGPSARGAPPSTPRRERLNREHVAAALHQQRRRGERLAGERRLAASGSLPVAEGPAYSCAPLRAAVALLPPPCCLSDRVYSAQTRQQSRARAG